VDLYPSQSKVIFQARSKTLDIKEHRQYKFTDMKCRKCGCGDETFLHVVNCGQKEIVDGSLVNTTADFTYDMKVKLGIIANRVIQFLEEVG
jgi:hypothetical protein